jgi:ribosomal protein S18 acetylase RimI-like enzyme
MDIQKAPIEIIPCNFENLRHCEALINLMNEYRLDKMGDGQAYSDEEKEKLVEGLKHHATALVYIAWTGDRYIGLITSFVNFATFSVKPFINIHDIIVAESWRNKGLGRQLITRVIEEAETLGCGKVTLEVREDNDNARHLYNSMGFFDGEPRNFYWAKYM